MTQSKTSDAGRLLFADVAEFVSEASRRRKQIEQETEGSPPPFYRLALGREAIDLGDVEFRILLLLASKPYRPFSRHRIAAAVSTPQQAVTPEAIDAHIA